MEITEQNILRLTIEHPNKCKQDRLDVMDYLDERFGEHGYRITRSGPKMIAEFTADMDTGKMIVEVPVPNA